MPLIPNDANIYDTPQRTPSIALRIRTDTHLGTKIIDRIRAGPLLEEHHQRRDEAPQRNRTRVEHVHNLLQYAEVRAPRKVRLDLLDGGKYSFVLGARACDERKAARGALVLPMLNEEARRLGLEGDEQAEEHAGDDSACCFAHWLVSALKLWRENETTHCTAKGIRHCLSVVPGMFSDAL